MTRAQKLYLLSIGGSVWFLLAFLVLAAGCAQKEPYEPYTVDGIPAERQSIYYGGSYYDPEREARVDLYTEDTPDREALVQRLAQTGVVVETAEYSHRELVSLMDAVNYYIYQGKNGKEGFTVVTWALDDQGSCVWVGLAENEPENQAAFCKAVTDSPAVRFEAVDPEGFRLD